MKRLLAIALAASLMTAMGAAQQATLTRGMLNPNAPIEISANASTFDQNSGLLVYSGNVVVRQGEVRMRADVMRAKLVSNKPVRINAEGRVVIDAPNGIATGDTGVYDVTPRLITLTGRVVLTQDRSVMRGQKLVVNLVNGLANLTGGAGGTTGRVQALFTPNTAQPAPQPAQNH
jgi:lipopolysaccharide export system protein LptA